MKRLSRNFSIDEFLRSQVAARHGIPMAPPPEVEYNLRCLAVDLLQPLRNRVGPIVITSGYRPRRLNRIIGGARNSAHIFGLAADIHAIECPLDELARMAIEYPSADQVIVEFGRWLHVSIAGDGKRPRRELLTAVRERRPLGAGFRTVYYPGIHTGVLS